MGWVKKSHIDEALNAASETSIYDLYSFKFFVMNFISTRPEFLTQLKIRILFQ
ncbi:MAG: hypothetical protein CM1200mP39_01370 [Dehalococcoidia bacterium]|nr:MAG: hypothetical protein CM1200mP39_01370 [Dehalococcoidia bacterium]